MCFVVVVFLVEILKDVLLYLKYEDAWGWKKTDVKVGNKHKLYDT